VAIAFDFFFFPFFLPTSSISIASDPSVPPFFPPLPLDGGHLKEIEVDSDGGDLFFFFPLSLFFFFFLLLRFFEFSSLFPRPNTTRDETAIETGKVELDILENGRAVLFFFFLLCSITQLDIAALYYSVGTGNGKKDRVKIGVGGGVFLLLFFFFPLPIFSIPIWPRPCSVFFFPPFLRGRAEKHGQKVKTLFLFPCELVVRLLDARSPFSFSIPFFSGLRKIGKKRRGCGEVEHDEEAPPPFLVIDS